MFALLQCTSYNQMSRAETSLKSPYFGHLFQKEYFRYVLWKYVQYKNLLCTSYNKVARTKTSLNDGMLPFSFLSLRQKHLKNIWKSVRICKFGVAETSLNNAPFSK